jgi:glycosyltransferase involved in cell wall biosynthesis
MTPVSVVICCANVADTLTAALESVAWADDVVVVDSGSIDATPEIAARFGVRYVVEPWRGYTAQKQYGVSLARHEWVLVLDGDEACSPALAEEIRGLSREYLDRHDVLHMRRRNFVMGRRVRAWEPDWQSRLIHRHRCRWADEVLHDRRVPSHPSRQARLRHHLEHKQTSAGGFRDYFHGGLEDARVMMVARQHYDRGVRCRWYHLMFWPTGAFLKFYVLRLACLDGVFGLLIAQKAARGEQLRWAALWALQQGLDRSAEGGQ